MDVCNDTIFAEQVATTEVEQLRQEIEQKNQKIEQLQQCIKDMKERPLHNPINGAIEIPQGKPLADALKLGRMKKPPGWWSWVWTVFGGRCNGTK